MLQEHFIRAQRLAASQEKSPAIAEDPEPEQFRAQRLAASQEKSPDETAIHVLPGRCSTPRGITGKIALAF